MAVAGNDYCIVAGSTRLSTGYSILTRNQTKILRLSDTCMIASAGMQADRQALHKMLHTRHVQYQFNHRKPMSANAVAQLLSTTLYHKRFFPYYTFNLCCGLDEEGRGAIYSYDAIGSFERVPFSASGSGQSYVIPLLDNIVTFKNRLDEKPELTPDYAVSIAKEAFVSAGERDIYTGDAVEIVVITKDGMTSETFPLKKD